MNKRTNYVKGKNWTMDKRKYIEKMNKHPEAWTITEMAVFLGISENMVRYHLQQIEK